VEYELTVPTSESHKFIGRRASTLPASVFASSILQSRRKRRSHLLPLISARAKGHFDGIKAGPTHPRLRSSLLKLGEEGAWSSAF
jgi:hypothetical protein